MADDELKKVLAEQSADLRRHVDAGVEQIEQRFVWHSAELRLHFDAGVEQIEQRFVLHAVDLRLHFDVAVERMDKRFDLLSETVAQLDQKLERTATDLRDEMQRGFADTQAMIKFSHAELDRRVRTLESHRSPE